MKLTESEATVMARLNLNSSDRLKTLAVQKYVRDRDDLFVKMPDIARIYRTFESRLSDQPEAANKVLGIMEAFLWGYLWVETFKTDSSATNECRNYIRDLILQVLEIDWLQSPGIVNGLILNSLVIENTTRRSGLKRFFRNKESEMLEQAIRELSTGITFDSATSRLRVLESHGVFFDAGIFQLLELRKTHTL